MTRHGWQFDLQWARACGAVVVGFVLATGALHTPPPAAPLHDMRPVTGAMVTLRWILGAALGAAAALLQDDRC